MTVKELITILEEYDENMIVIYSTQEDNEEPSPNAVILDFDTNYYTGKEFKSIKKGTKFVIL